MARKTFSKFGLKRDLNLSDVPNKKQAIDNILDGLADGAESFTWEDIEAIRDISLSNITTSTINSAADATVKKIAPNAELIVYDPLITLENRFDKAYFTTAEPYFFGGDGLTASYYDSNAIQRSTAEDPASNFTGFNSSLLVKQDNFWERGNFSYSNKIIIDFATLYGGVQWEGYFKSNQNGPHRLRITTSGFVKIEFDDKSESRDFIYDSNTGTFNYNNYDFTKMDVLADQTKLDQSSDLTTAVIAGTSSSLGDQRTIEVDLGTLVQWEAYKIRITYFVDPEAIPVDTSINKYINIDIIRPQSGLTNLNYKFLYTKNYFQNYDIGDFRAFVEDSISLGGTEIGNQRTIGDVKGEFISSTETPTNGDSYRNLNNIGPIVSYYKFPKQISDPNNTNDPADYIAGTYIKLPVSGCSYSSGNTNISVSNSNANSVEGIEIGNYVIGNGISPGTRVTSVVINNSVNVSPAPTSNGSGTLEFINHKGLIGFGVGDVSDHQITNITASHRVSNVNTNDIVLSNGLSFTFNDDTNSTINNQCIGRLVESYDGSTISLKGSSTTNSIGNQEFYIYSTTGLIDNGLKFFCQGVLKARLLATQSDTTSNSVTINVDDVTGITNDMYVHAFPSVNFGQRSDGTATEFHSKVQVTSISGNTITITGLNGEPALLSGLEYNSEKIKNIVFTDTDVNKEVCFKPTDTSPPFAASSTGLTTSLNVSAVDDFSKNGGGNINTDSKVTYSQLEIKHDSNASGNVIVYDGETISDYLPIEDADGNTFYILLGD